LAVDASRPREIEALFRDLSEPGRGFLSDNWVSNETSYLQPKGELAGRTGGAYIGVGPEQSFSYIALTKPALAFILDLRRDNAIEHFFYKALFEMAQSREEFRALLVGGPSPRIRERVESFFEGTVKLDGEDAKTLDTIASVFKAKGLGIRFEMHDENGRTYPTLASLLDEEGSFLASEEAFRFVQTMQREDRIVPVVGDFAGPHALRAIGDELRKRRLVVSTFYVSNVEQYVMADGKWKDWTANIRALPSDDRSVFIRCYLDQGKPHPKQRKGHRTATVLQTFERFQAKSWTSWFELATDS
jgi:hypothetical protein